MGKILLSICISSYNKGDRCYQLVQNILAVEDDRYNIFICDDASNAETVRKLKSLQNSKVIFIQNRKNIGACRNWYKTIDCGDGDYILHILDRDDILAKSIKMIIDILEKHFIGAGYIGKSAMSIDNNRERVEKFIILEKGRDAFLTMAGVPVHPTGFLVNRTEWKTNNYKKFFYQSEKYGIYPHSYVLGKIALKKDMLYMPISFCSYIYIGENKQSRFYQKNKKKDYWWLPDNVIKTANKMLVYLYNFADDSYKEEFICKRFQEGLYRTTIGYKAIVASKSEMQHYGLSVVNVSRRKLILYSLKYKLVFVYVLNKIGSKGWNMHKILMGKWITNIKDIIKI